MPAGRPTKYNKDILTKAQDYLVNYDQHEHPFPSEAGLARVLGLSLSTVKDWASHKDKKEFSATLDEIKTEQHIVALHKGIKGEFNAAITKLVLHNHGYTEKQQVEQSGVTVVKIKGEF